LWQTWESGLRRAGVTFECRYTEGEGHAVTLARGAAGHDLVVAVGGDGTINEVLDGIVQSGSPDLRMGVLYSGTSPDFCRFHGIPTEPEAALQSLLGGGVRRVDVARIAYHDAAGQQQVSHFGCSCSIGMGAAVARAANRWRKHLGDTLGTGAAVVRALLGHRPVDLRVEIDGEVHSLPNTNNLSVVKNPFLASGLKLRLEVGPADGRLWVVGVHGKGWAGLCALLPGFYSGKATAASAVFVRPARVVTVTAEAPHEIEFDGDPRGFLPARTEILPQALALVGGAHD